jgi:predicted alpha-1,2-mannosidase
MQFVQLLIANSLLWTIRLVLLVAFVAMAIQCGAEEPQGVSLSQRVNPFIGTGGNPYVCGNNSPAATLPFGLVRLCLDTVSNEGVAARNMSGYYYPDELILGFSHTRLCGTGAIDGGSFRIYPGLVTGEADSTGRPDNPPLKFDHQQELASPGYYAVTLPSVSVRAELTATLHVGLHRYTFAAGAQPQITLDAASALGRGRTEDCELSVDNRRREITGSTRMFGSFSKRYGGLPVYFVARFRAPWTTCRRWTDRADHSDPQSASGDGSGVVCDFEKSAAPQVIELAVALSHVSIANARDNLEVELGERSFDEVRQAATAEWDAMLSSVQLEGGTAAEQTMFYTALFRAFSMPTTFSDANGEYLGFDKLHHSADGFQYYTDMSLWDTFRTAHPLYTLLIPERHRDMLVSLVNMAAQGGGTLPRWPAGCGYTSSMFGAPADVVIAEAWLKGIREFDVEAAYEAMRAAAVQPTPPGANFSPREDIDQFIRYGYCPSDTMSEAVAKTLEYSTSDAAIGRLAAALGREADAELFATRSLNYRNVWNSETQYFQPRDSSGRFSTPLKPLLLTYVDFGRKYTDDYVEGSALQWRWAVPHDAAGFVELFSSRDYFVDELDEFFAKSVAEVGALPNGYYWHGNQPDIHAVYLFNAAGRPDMTQQWVRWILKHKYGDGPHGLDGNDDGGTLSAWYVLSSLGLYPLAGSERYELGCPIWKRAVVRLGDTKLEIVADELPVDRTHFERVELNGLALDRWWLTHSELLQGGVLRFR